MKKITVLISLFSFSLFLEANKAHAQLKHFPVINLFFKNQFDKQGLHHGRWVTFTEGTAPEERTKVKGRYKHGFMVGKWRTFYPDNSLKLVEKCRKKGWESLIHTTQYYPNGTVAVTGTAAYSLIPDSTRYYRTGEWVYYHQDASLDRKEKYEDGWPVKTTYADGRVVVSKPAKAAVKKYKPGERPAFVKKNSFKMTTDSEGQQIIINYDAQGDSTITVLPPRTKD
ncbi:toxin-antitoxin system YwqK family antitoxin [Pontibacter sp. SGAir0037]|uniref:toxin-antitoxin system YwqK family antitoxin n=1 Tax=Pontibacter sp. SGAir0037 TaxID=2571030 RepID=UPI0010CD5992|nr:hypothetical protein [Pontibacter sp. SGAir0037]QCR22227.1 hypothetical protein C1N53_07640 [Pontibacter sp. SGAir0037]